MMNKHFPLVGKSVLEIGCVKGRVSRDPDAAAIAVAQAKSQAANINFMHSLDGDPALAKHSVDLVVYTLSLHHVPKEQMHSSLQQAGKLLKEDGGLLILEPAEGGSFNEAKNHFGIGSGDERPLIAAALSALQTLPGRNLSIAKNFMTEFWFANQDDFFTSKLPHFREFPDKRQAEITTFLHQHSADNKIVLTAERSLYRLIPLAKGAKPAFKSS